MPDNNENATREPGQPEYEEVVVYRDTSAKRRILAVVLALLVLLLVAVIGGVLYLATPKTTRTVKTPKGITWVRSIYALRPGTQSRLNAPSDVAIDPQGGIWTTNGSVAIFGFNPDGTAKGVIIPPRQDKPGFFKTVEGLVIGPDGSFHITDQQRNKVIVYSANRAFEWEWGVEYPTGIVALGDDKYALTGGGGVAVVQDKKGTPVKLLAKFGSRGKKADQFDLPKSIAVGKDGTLFIADTENQRVSAYTQAGKRLWTTGNPQYLNAPKNNPTSPFQVPSGVTVDGNGRVIVIDAFAFKVFALDPKTGKIVDSWGDYGTEDGYFSYASAIKYDPVRDWFVVADTSNNRLQIIRLPNSGGSVTSAFSRALVYPLWVCSIPLALLFIAIVLGTLGSRRRRRLKQELEKAA